MMHSSKLVAFLLAIVAVSGCGASAANVTPWPTEWAALRGQRVTVEGKAANAKAGAIVVRGKEDPPIWIDGLASWPAGYDHGGSEGGACVRVTGIVIERSDLPALVEKPSEPAMQGIPAASDADRERASRRYLLKDATWEVH
jgi:hypothetical protein